MTGIPPTSRVENGGGETGAREPFPIERLSKKFFRQEVRGMARIISQNTIKKTVIRDMKSLGVYRPEYDRLIDIYAGLIHQYQRALKDFEESGCKYETETGTGGTKKSAIVATLENLRKDILAYSDRLCLNPKALENVTTDSGSKSKLAQILSELK